MNSTTNRYLHGMLTKTAHGLAGYAAGELLDRDPQAASVFQPDSFVVWQQWMTSRVQELAAAVAAGRPALLITQLQWAQAVHAARGLSADQFLAGMESLRDVLAKELPEATRTLATSYVDQGLAGLRKRPADMATPRLADTPDGRLAAAYILTLLEGDRRQAGDLILDVARHGRPVPEIYQQILVPAQEEIGRMWMADEINVAEEHFASSTTKRVMAQLAQYATYRPHNGRTLLAAAVVGNFHDIGLAMVADLFEMDGWRVIQLGADVPIADLVQAVDCFAVDLVGISVARNMHLESLRLTIAALRAAPRGATVKILVGGAALADADLAHELGADAYAANAGEALHVARQLVERRAEPRNHLA